MKGVLLGRRGPIGLVTCVFLGACALVRNPPPAPPRHASLGLAISSTTLGNGLRVVLVKDPQASEIQVTMRYAVGAGDDLENPGIAHLVEHLMFQQVLGSETLMAHLEDEATYFNAFTVFDSTTYISRAAPDKLEKLLSIEAVRLGFRCTSITDSAFLREREVVTQEAKLRDEASELMVALHRAVYPQGHPYTHAIGGSVESVEAITRDEACRFADAYYAPSNAVLVISGNLANDQVERALGKFLARIARRVAASPAPVPPAPVAKGSHTTAPAPIDDDALLVVWPLPAQPDLRIGMQAIAAVSAGVIDLSVKGQVAFIQLGDVRAPMIGFVIVPASGESVDEVLATTREMIDGLPAVLKHRAVSESIFDQIQQQAIYAQYASLEDGSTRDSHLAAYALAGRDPAEALGEEFRGLRALRREETAAIARQYLAMDRASVVTLKGREGKKRGHRIAVQVPTHDMGQRRTPPDPARAHEPAQVAPPPSLGIRTRVLPNGLHVVLLPLATVPTVDARLVFAAGSADEPVAKRGAAHLAGETLTWDLRYLNDALAFMTAGGTVDARVDRDHTSFAVRGVDMHLDYLLAGLRRWVVDGRYDNSAEDRAEALQHQSKRLDDEGALTDAWRVARYGASHPYTRADLPRYASDNLRVEDAETFRAEHYTPDNATLVIAGHFDAALADRWIDFLFADWTGHAQPRRSPVAATQPASIAKVEDLTQMRLTLALPARSDERAQGLVAAAMLDAIAKDVRHQLGAAYSFDAWLDESRLANSFLFDGWIDPTRASEVMELLRDRIASLHDDPDAAARAFVMARRRVITQLVSLVGSASMLASRVDSDVALGREPMSDLATASAVRALTIENMTATLAELDLSRAAILMRGPADAVNAGFGVLGRTPTIVKVDPAADDAREDTADGRSAEHHRGQKLMWSDIEGAITEQGPPSRLLLEASVSYASGSLVHLVEEEPGLEILEDPTGTLFAANAGFRFTKSSTLGLHLAAGSMHGTYKVYYGDPQPYSLVPIDIGVFVQASGYDRFWGGLNGSLHFDGTRTDGERAWTGGFSIGAFGGVDALRFGRHRLGLFLQGSGVWLTTTGLGLITVGAIYRY